MSAPWIGRPVIYRCYDAAGVLLYVGSSINVETRMDSHFRGSFWSGQVVKIRIAIASDEIFARRIEARAIREENPRFNLHHRRPRPLWTEQDYLDVMSALRRGSSSYTAHTRQRLRVLAGQLEAFRAGASA